MSLAVVVADDQPLVRAGFRVILESQADIRVVAEAGDGAEAVSVVRDLSPDVVLMDIRMPHVNGIDATRRIRASGSRSRILILTTFDLDEYVYQALRAGATGFLLKDVTRDELVRAVRLVAAGASRADHHLHRLLRCSRISIAAAPPLSPGSLGRTSYAARRRKPPSGHFACRVVSCN